MREIRTFELDQADLATGIFIARPHTLRVCRGLLWITVEGEAADMWLSAGDTIELPAGTTVWVGAQAPGGRFDLAFESALPSWRALLERLVAGFGRRPAALHL
jgi:hypothetical protein